MPGFILKLLQHQVFPLSYTSIFLIVLFCFTLSCRADWWVFSLKNKHIDYSVLTTIKNQDLVYGHGCIESACLILLLCEHFLFEKMSERNMRYSP